MKRRFRILHLAPEYNIEVQARLPVSLAALHNFIRIHDPKEEPVIGSNSHHSTQADDAEEQVLRDGLDSGEIDGQRDQIADAMWIDYQRICHERGIDVNNPFDVDDDDDVEDLFDVEGDVEGDVEDDM